MDAKCSEIKTNEQIIEELTKGLKSSCIKVDENCIVSNDDTAGSTAVKGNIPSGESCKNTKTDSDKNGKCENRGDDDDDDDNDDSNDLASHARDVTDEDALKDRDLTLSESEKELFKDVAEKHKEKGNMLFKDGEYTEAVLVYTQGIQTCPLVYRNERSILYSNRAAAKSKCLERESAISDCTKAIELNPDYAKAYVRRGQLYEESEKLDEALEDFKKVLTLDPSHVEANRAVRRLPPLIDERNEKLKTEMLGKLKDLGNMVLKPFGLSTNNFELQKDPNSGGYSVKFQQNPS